MQTVRKQKTPSEENRVVSGLFSKKEAAVFISQGVRHVHSSTLGTRDACAQLTHQSMSNETIPTYPWEQPGAEALQIISSAQRYDQIKEIIERGGIGGKRDLKEKLETVLEELLSNAIYHAYHKPDGTDRYARRDNIKLSDAEKIAVGFRSLPEGFFLSVSDQGGNFRFRHVSSSFGRCYGDAREQIEAKESGAGLGLYMAFEVMTHLKVVTKVGQETTISGWIADKHTFDPDSFSFNFFERR